MALIGTLSTLQKQCNNEAIKKALDYLTNTDLDRIFNGVSVGRPVEVEIDERNIFAIFQSYETKDLAEAKMEGHKKYIDVQYLHSGVEQILVTPESRITKEADYDEEKDLHFPKVLDYSSVRLTAGMGCVLYPEDLHAPCISIDAPSTVQKIVVKVAVEN